MEAWQSDPIATPQTSAGAEPWKSDPIIQAAPKPPDVSGVQKITQDNLASGANDNEGKPQTPMQHLNTASGIPVDKIINGTAQPTDINAAHRVQYLKATDNGSADNGSDWMQTVLHAVMPVIAGGIYRTAHPVEAAQESGESVVQGFKGGAGQIMYPFLSPESKQELLENEQLTPYKDPENPTATEIARRTLELEQATVGKGMGGLYAPMGAIAPILNPIIQSTGGQPTKTGEVPTWSSLIPSTIGAGMDILGGLGIHATAGELSALRAQRSAGPMPEAGAGAWDHAIREAVAQKLDKEPAAVTPADVNQVIAEGSKDLHPPKQDFPTAASATGIPEQGFKTVYADSGVTPERILTDIQHNPEIVADVAAGKVPEQYAYLKEDREFQPPQTEKMFVKRDESTRSFTVVDKDGDHIQGGFDSYDEAQQHIEDLRYDAEERAAIENEERTGNTPTTEKTAAGEQTVIPGAEKISDKDAERKMEQPLQAPVPQKTDIGGLFDTEARKQPDLFESNPITEVPVKAPIKNIIPPSERGKVTSLKTFLANNGAKFDENGELVSMKDRVSGQVRKGDDALDHAGQMAQQHGYFKERPLANELQNTLRQTEGGKEHFRIQDADRIANSRESALAKQYNDPVFLEHEAHNVGIDTERVAGETEKQWTNRLKQALQDFYSEQSGSIASDAYRRIIGNTIIAAEKFAGKLGGTFFQKLADGYVKTFQPELMGDKALRADAYLAKYKAVAQEAENAYYRQFQGDMSRWDKATKDQQLKYIDDHETGRWNETDDPEHAAHQALLDKTFEEEKKAIGADSEKGYKENYLPIQFKDPVKVREFFDSPGMTRKYGADWFTKPRQFNMIQDAIRAGFELRTYNPARMIVSRLLAGDNMIRTMDLLHDMESSGVATRATSFSVDKRIAKTQAAIDELNKNYKADFEKIEKQATLKDEHGKPIGEPTPKRVLKAQERLQKLNDRLNAFNKEKSDINLTPQQLKDLKNGFRIIGPDSKAWNIHPEVAAVWKNAMEMKGLYENQGITGDVYRAFTQAKNLWTDIKLSLSLFHPFHEVGINLASAIAGPVDHLIKGGKFSDLGAKDAKNLLPIGDTSAIKAYNTPDEARTPQQKADVQRMMEGGFVPTMSARDAIHFRENFDKGIAKVGINNLRLLGTVVQLPGKILEPLYSRWIPNLRSQMYMSLTEKALQRDPTLSNDAGRRGEIFREISKNVDRTFGQLNQDTLFWNKTIRDAFNASYISGGWKLAQIYNARGLTQPLKIAYKFAKTGEFSKNDITYNMLHSYAYTGVTLMMGAAINKMLGNPIGKTYQESKNLKDFVWSIAEDCLFPRTGDKNPDGTPIRLNQPAFTKEHFMLARDINEHGLVAGAGEFIYHGTIIPSIVDTLNNRDFIGREEISNPLDLHQWTNAGWDAINPITASTYERAEEKGSKTAAYMGLAGFPIAGAYINQSPFEQKVIAKYSEQNPPKEDVYHAKLKAEMHGAVSNKDTKAEAEIAKRMKEEGMSAEQIAFSKRPFTEKFSEFAWKKLSSEDQRKLISSASEEEKKKFKIKAP